MWPGLEWASLALESLYEYEYEAEYVNVYRPHVIEYFVFPLCCFVRLQEDTNAVTKLKTQAL